MNQPTQRSLIHRTAGRSRGGITRLVSPGDVGQLIKPCLLYTSPSPRDGLLSRMPSSA